MIQSHFRKACGFLLLFGSAVLVGCRQPEPPLESFERYRQTSSNLRPIARYPLALAEPSGLCLGADGESLWTVSDDDSRVYQIDLTGRALRSFSTGYRDLEGIAEWDDGSLAVISERERKLLRFSQSGELLDEMLIDIPGSDNDGPEGLAYDPINGILYLLEERPGTLLELNHEGVELRRRELTFSRDYSSIHFEPVRGHLWVMSDQSGTIHVLDIDLKMLTSFSIGLEQLEGVAVDYAKRRIYAVSDPLGELFVFEFDPY